MAYVRTKVPILESGLAGLTEYQQLGTENCIRASFRLCGGMEGSNVEDQACEVMWMQIV